MAKIYLVRHGAYGADGGLDIPGAIQIARAAEEIKTDLDSYSIKEVEVYSSPKKRAVQSAEILKDRLEAKAMQIEEALNEDESKVGTLVRKLQIEDGKRGAVLVSHMPDIEHFLREIGRYKEVEKGEVVHV